VTDTWEVLDGGGVTLTPRLGVVGDRLVGVTTSLTGTTLTLQAFASEGGRGPWVRIEDPPLAGQRCGIGANDWGDAAVFDVCSGYVLLDRERRWTVIPRPPGNRMHRSTMIAAGDWLYAIDPGDGDDTTSGPPSLYRRPRPDAVGPAVDPPKPSTATPPDDTATRPTVVIGSATLDLPPGYSILDGSEPTASVDAPGITFALPEVPPWPPEPPCTIEVTEIDPAGATFEELAARSGSAVEGFGNQVILTNGSVDERYHVLVRLQPDEVLDIACAQRLNPEALFAALR